MISTIPLLLQPDIGSALILLILGFGIFIAKYGWKYPLFLAFIAAVPIIVLTFSAAYRLRRLKAWLDPWQDPLNKGFQIIQGLIAFANGGFWGLDLGGACKNFNIYRLLTPISFLLYVLRSLVL